MPGDSGNRGVNRINPDLWKADILRSVDMYNKWFMDFAPVAYRAARIKATKDVTATLDKTRNLTDVSAELLRREPNVLPTLRMSTCPPIAVDRLVGLAGVSKTLVSSMEEGRIPLRIMPEALESQLKCIGTILERLADPDIFTWLGRRMAATQSEIQRAATIVADRLCGAVANPTIRNAQEKRQLAAIEAWLQKRGYRRVPPKVKFDAMPSGTYANRLNVPVKRPDQKRLNIPVDAVVMPKSAKPGELPLLIEAKSAGDYTNVNKRRKEEATKMNQLRDTYGKSMRFILFLCGYFDTGYLGYEAAEGIDWVWEHRIEELAKFGL